VTLVPSVGAHAEATDYPALFGFPPSCPMRRVGEMVSASGRVCLYFGQWQVGGSTVMSMGMGTVPDPVVVPAADIATGGPRAGALEAVLVRVEGVSVLDANPDAPSEYGEIEVTDELRIDDWMTPLTAFRTVGTRFTSITGVLVFRFSNSKISPRTPADIVSP